MIIMYDEKNRKTIIGIGVIASFALLLITLTFYYNIQHTERHQGHLSRSDIEKMTKDEIADFMEQRQASMPKVQGFYLFPFIGFIGLFVGTLVYFIMSEKIVIQEKTLQKNTKIILKFLTPEERKVIDTLLENKGKVQQYELSHLPDLNKVKTHRILVNLEQKGIIEKEKLGKINKIILNRELYDLLKDSSD